MRKLNLSIFLMVFILTFVFLINGAASLNILKAGSLSLNSFNESILSNEFENHLTYDETTIPNDNEHVENLNEIQDNLSENNIENSENEKESGEATDNNNLNFDNQDNLIEDNNLQTLEETKDNNVMDESGLNDGIRAENNENLNEENFSEENIIEDNPETEENNSVVEENNQENITDDAENSNNSLENNNDVQNEFENNNNNDFNQENTENIIEENSETEENNSTTQEDNSINNSENNSVIEEDNLMNNSENNAIIEENNDLSLSESEMNKESGENDSAKNNKIKITLNGSGCVFVKPDKATIVVGVETLNSNIVLAQEENNNTMQKVLEVLTSYGIENDKIQTKNYYINEKYDYLNGNKFIGNKVSNFIEFETSNLDNLENLLRELARAGANNFSGINFCLSNYSKEYNRALNEAVKNAENKLIELGYSKENFHISKLTECESYNNMCAKFSNLKIELNAENYIQIGEIKICANVIVVFQN